MQDNYYAAYKLIERIDFILLFNSPLTFISIICAQAMLKRVTFLSYSSSAFSIDNNPSVSKRITCLTSLFYNNGICSFFCLLNSKNSSFYKSAYNKEIFRPFVHLPALVIKFAPNKRFKRVDLPVLYGPITDIIKGFSSFSTSISVINLLMILMLN